MSFILAVIVGIIGGAAAVLPLSGSAYASIIAGLFGFSGSGEDYLLMCVFTEVGTLAPIIITYRKYFHEMQKAISLSLRGEGRQEILARPRRTMGLIAAGTIPLLLGAVFRKQIAILYHNYLFIGIALIGTGLIILASEKFMEEGEMKEGQFSPLSALFVGFGQAVAMLPGFSRTAVAVAMTKARGGEDGFAFRFAMLLAVPAIVCSLIGDLIGTIGADVNRKLIPMYLVSMAFSAITSFAALNIGRRMYKRGLYIYFSYLSIPVGAVSILAGLLF